MLRLLLLPPRALLLCALLMLLLHFAVPTRQIVPHPQNWLGLLLLGAGLAMAAWHARLFRQEGTNIQTFGEPGQLTTGGLFRHTRNPMYLGMLLALSGMATVLGSLAPLAGPLVFFSLAQFWYIPYEERAMHRKFGEAYQQYCRTVRRWW